MRGRKKRKAISEELHRKYALKAVFTQSNDWREFHEIQRTSLFQQDDGDEYDADFQDGYFFRPALRTQLLLKDGDIPLGITTLDIINEKRAITRGVAIDKNYQGQGHGKILGKLVQDFARAKGIETLCVNADAEKTGYYKSLGFKVENWDLSEWNGQLPDHVVQMTCKL